MPHSWRTPPDPFADVWAGVVARLALPPGLEAWTLFRPLPRDHPGRFPDGPRRTFRRRVQTWRATHGPAKDVFFARVHTPGRWCASDVTHRTDLRVTIAGRPFEHLLDHFVRTYSNWEAGTVGFAASFETRADGWPNAVAERGGVPAAPRTDRLTAAIPPGTTGAAFPPRYQALLAHDGLDGQAIPAGHGNENGDVEPRHRRFTPALDPQLMLRGCRDVASRDAGQAYRRDVFGQWNANRGTKTSEERAPCDRGPRTGSRRRGGSRPGWTRGVRSTSAGTRSPCPAG
ncbi:Mobile element protein [Fimbriiglobus ruber]|uniref:Mobile element protein n=2 Tax=Fimbriiglobus ruber TaxID=1908690 RepID=A0A225DUH1_9BACT|nr:Mobile element protein [Fimbriiglobus ruber]